MKLSSFPFGPAILFVVAGAAGFASGGEPAPKILKNSPIIIYNNHPEEFERPAWDATLRQTPSGVIVEVNTENRDGKALAVKNEVVLIDDQETPLNLSTQSYVQQLSPSDANVYDMLAVPMPTNDGYYVVLVRTAILDVLQPGRGAVKEQRRFVYVENELMTPVSEEEFSNNSRMNLARTFDEGGEQ